MSALYGWTSQGCSSPQGQAGPVVHRVEAKSYRSPGCPSRAFLGEGCYWARAGWWSSNVALEETPSLPTDPQDLQSEPFWRMNKYFTQH